MANTLNIPERTLEQIGNSTNSINVINGVDGRKSPLQPLVCRITDHVHNVVGETGTDTEKMAIFKQKAHGHPWLKDQGQEHIVHQAVTANLAMIPTNVTVLYPDFDYATFE